MLSTIRIEVQDAGVLDGTSPLNLADPNITVDRNNPGEVVVTIPSGTSFGSLDVGDLLRPNAGAVFGVQQISVVSSGGAHPSGGTDIVERATPTVGSHENVDQIQDLGSNGGAPPAGRRLFLPDHHLAFTTTVTGPHVITFLAKEIRDEDVEGNLTEGSSVPGGIDSLELKSPLEPDDLVEIEDSADGFASKKGRLQDVDAGFSSAYVRIYTQAQLEAIASLPAGTEARVHPGSYSLTSPIQIPAGVSVVGVGGQKPLIEVPDGVNNQAFRIAGSNTRISNLRFKHLGNPSTAAVGILIHGTPDNIEIDRCRVEDFWHCYQVQGTDISTRATNIRFINCYASSFNEGWYGYDLHWAENVTFRDCVAFECGADGFKVSQGCYNVSILGGQADRNGMTTTPGVNGQGVDAFAGGDALIIDGLTCDGNGVNTPVQGGGILVKSSTGTGPTAGYMRRIIVTNCKILNTKKGIGLVVYTEPVTSPDAVLLQSATVTNNIIDGGEEEGVRLGGVNITFMGNQIRRNAQTGVLVDAKSIRCVVLGNVFIANSFGNPNTSPNMVVTGNAVTVSGNIFDGQLNDDAQDKADIDGSTSYPSRHITITTGSSDVRVTPDNQFSGAVSGIPVHVTGSSPGTIFDRIGVVLPNSGGSYGGPGSIYRRHNAISDETLFWVKPIASAATSPFGWEMLHAFIAKLIAYQDLKDTGYFTATMSANAVTLDFTNGNWAEFDMDGATAAVAVTLENMVAGGPEYLVFVQNHVDGPGSTWQQTFTHAGATIRWDGGAQPSLPADMDDEYVIYSFRRIGNTILAKLAYTEAP